MKESRRWFSSKLLALAAAPAVAAWLGRAWARRPRAPERPGWPRRIRRFVLGRVGPGRHLAG